eukprot:3462162-Amphidinium_carterae.1
MVAPPLQHKCQNLCRSTVGCVFVGRLPAGSVCNFQIASVAASRPALGSAPREATSEYRSS